MGSKSMCNSDEEGELRRGPWTLEEDNLLLKYISCQGEGRWNLLAKCAGLKRTGKSCRLRWLNYLKPDVKRGNLTPQEQLLILELHSQWGNKWSKIAQHLPGRTDNEIKNYWRTRVQKQARQLKIDSNSKSFLDAVRYFWAPNMHQTNDKVVSPPHFPSSSSTMNSTMPSPITNMPSSPSPSAVPGINHADNYASLTSPTSMSSAHLLQNSQFPEVLEHPINPYSFDNSFNDHAIPNGNFSVVDNCSYDMGDYNPHPTSAMGIYDISMSDYPIAAGGDWASGDMEQTVPIWNMDELWQFEPRIDDH